MHLSTTPRPLPLPPAPIHLLRPPYSLVRPLHPHTRARQLLRNENTFQTVVFLHAPQAGAAAPGALGCFAQTRLFVAAQTNGDEGDGQDEDDDGYDDADNGAGTEAVAAGGCV